MSHPTGIVGYALYIESRSEEFTTQLVWTPPLIDPSSKEFVGPAVIRRVISPVNPKSTWRVRDIDMPDASMASDGTVSQITDLPAAFEAVKPILALMSKQIGNGAKNEWKYQGAPLVVEMTATDAKALRMKDTPTALIRRITNARGDASYPFKVLVEPDTATSAPATTF